MTVRHEDINIYFQSFHLLSQSIKVNRVWEGMWVAIVSEIWNYRNKMVFKGRVVDHEEIFFLAQLKGWLWLKYKRLVTSFSFSDWNFLPLKCLRSLV